MILIIISLGVLLLLAMEENSLSEGEATPVPSSQAVYDSFFDPRSFSYGNNGDSIEESKIFGAVVPHHLLAYKLIDSVFTKIALEKPSTIILIGPNHFNQGPRILTTSWGWQTPFGIVESDQTIIDSLAASQMVKVNEEVFKAEHSIGNLMPFLKFYLPETRLVPIILHHDVTRQEARELGKYLAELVEDKNYLIMASVDFSHYLTREAAELKDRETIEALENKNMGKIFSMGNDYLDSPASIGVLFSAMEELSKEDFRILDNTNSGVILNNDLIETTSYFTLIFE